MRGIPANNGAANAEEIPGMISNPQPAFFKASISKIQRPNIKGSPDFNLITCFFSKQYFTNKALISVWEVLGLPPRLPTSIFKQSTGTQSNN